MFAMGALALLLVQSACQRPGVEIQEFPHECPAGWTFLYTNHLAPGGSAVCRAGTLDSARGAMGVDR
jgi:hypothetical protein